MKPGMATLATQEFKSQNAGQRFPLGWA